MDMIFKSFHDLNDYLTEIDLINMEELTEALLTEAEAEAEVEED